MKISIIIPSYNQGPFIGRTIESILSQEGNFEIECLVFDGGSTDATLDVLKNTEKNIAKGTYKKLNDGIFFEWISKKDKGQSDAINQGLKIATGDIVAFLNSDDEYFKDCFKKVIKVFAQRPEAKWTTGQCKIVDNNGHEINSWITKYKNFYLNKYSYNKLLALNFISQPATFWKKSLTDEAGGFREDLHYAMDYEFWLRVGKQYQPVIINDFLAKFRIHDSSKGKLSFLTQFDEDYRISTSFTRNKVLHFLHKTHNTLIKTVYRITK